MIQKLYFIDPHSLSRICALRNASQPAKLIISLDLGLTHSDGIFFPPATLKCNKIELKITDEMLHSSDNRTIYIWRDGEWQKWQLFDDQRRNYYKMVFVKPDYPPTIEISGVKMHTTKDGDPQQDTQRKLESLKNVKGKVLDTCMGLGYTAIAAAHITSVESVICCERDLSIIRFSKENPWSQSLFNHEKIYPLLFPVQEFVATLPEQSIQTIIHDPPRFALAPELYAENFYTDLFRIMAKGGQLYHYTGDPNRQVRGISLAKKTRGLLLRVGFRDVKDAYAGLVVRK